MGGSTVEEILDFAIQMEQDAVDLYTDLATKTNSQSAKVAFEEDADEERGHKSKLEEIKSGKRLVHGLKPVLDLKISDYIQDQPLGDNPGYQEVLIFAIRQEKIAYKLYTRLAEQAQDESIKKLLLSLAQEEAKHKLSFEVEYDEHIYKEN
ncbi:MAG: ferritin family protein [Proteobacteria bacterium]|nr:ferritin family protein [Pseudomonadota bacterium]